MYKVGQLCEGVNFINHPEYNGVECTILSGIQEAEGTTPKGVRGTARGYLVCWANGKQYVVDPNNLRPKRPPTEYKGEQQILSLFNVKPREVQNA